ncbi:Gamma-glutamyltranspeptidase [Artemisia annua]|uniref:Gamma-glutamyltranspeptidase n=1 Tax=Artemisia annua TaxID=35608 RepID=A0A2U1MUF7_ARTAN|nr:Gamma-glutamyltranspeptidase [Artemisia annua]
MHAAERSKRNKALLVCLNARMLLDEMRYDVVQVGETLVNRRDGEVIDFISFRPVFLSQNAEGDQLVGVIGGSGGMYLIPAVIQVFLNHFILGMEPLDAVQSVGRIMPYMPKRSSWVKKGL